MKTLEVLARNGKTQMGFACDNSLRERIEMEAQRNRRTLASEIRCALEDWYALQDERRLAS